MYVRELPHNEMKEICNMLDENERFVELGRDHMQFDSYTIQTVKQSPSPSRELLDLWDYHNHTVFELFILFGRMQLYQAMLVLQQFVDPKYHYLLKKTQMDIVDKMAAIQINDHHNNSEKILNCQPNIPPPIYISCDDNETQSTPPPPINQLKPPRSPLPGTSKTALSAISFVSQSAGAIPQIAYDDLMKATNNWDATTILGRGGFGIVFKGTWKCTKVAIKRIEQKEGNPDAYNEQIKQSITELHCLNACRHDNILPLYGYSVGGPQPCLVYQYMAGGSLEYRLHDRNNNHHSLNWQKRLDIAIGTARGLQFLHTIGDKPLIHGDIKSANILLDPNDTPRIGDFGLAREGPEYSYVKVSSIHGTRPYLPDEFLRLKKFSTKVDTYSFGIVLFEIATGQTAYSTRRPNRFLKDHVVDYEGDVMELKDVRAPLGSDGIFKSLIRVGQMCVNRNAKERPQMVTVLIQLEAIS